MESKQTTLLIITASLSKDGFRSDEIVRECTETSKSFLCEGRRVSKDKLMQIQTRFVETHRSLKYYMYCFPADKERAAKILRDYITQKALTYKSEIEVICKFI